jgi:hypothetical protein
MEPLPKSAIDSSIVYDAGYSPILIVCGEKFPRIALFHARWELYITGYQDELYARRRSVERQRPKDHAEMIAPVIRAWNYSHCSDMKPQY